ncbi:hypothetical protein SAMN05216428_10453 [Nitrosospira sp. Nsp11]|nr:hypothetical protein SAMN05216428_10453 [Nitrosospira sp. Nsp11]
MIVGICILTAIAALSAILPLIIPLFDRWVYHPVAVFT